MYIQKENYLQQRLTLLNTVGRIDPNILDLNNAKLTEILLCGKTFFDKMNNTSMLEATIKYLIETKRFDAQCYCCSPNANTLTLTLLLKLIFAVIFVCLFIFVFHF